MAQRAVHECECEICQGGEDHAHYQRMNWLMSRLDEPQRRWYAGVASAKLNVPLMWGTVSLAGSGAKMMGLVFIALGAAVPWEPPIGWLFIVAGLVFLYAAFYVYQLSQKVAQNRPEAESAKS